jgi:signal peptidase I
MPIPHREAVASVRSLALGLLVAVALRTAVFQPFTIPSSSMEPGLVTGDYIIVSKFAYGWSGASLPFDLPGPQGRLFGRQPARGDVVVFRLPRDRSQAWVKRVVGLPGDQVQVRSGTVFVNGRAVERRPLRAVPDHDAPRRTVMLFHERQPGGRSYATYGGEPGHEGDDTGVYTVPAGAYFVMGDNRDNSLDSRWPSDVGVGLLPTENVIGKAELVLASWKSGSSLLDPRTWIDLQPGRVLLRIR